MRYNCGAKLQLFFDICKKNVDFIYYYLLRNHAIYPVCATSILERHSKWSRSSTSTAGDVKRKRTYISVSFYYMYLPDKVPVKLTPMPQITKMDLCSGEK